MPKIFPNASKKTPCVVCGKEDWCSFGDRAMICRRVQSDKSHIDRSGNVDGWYHFYDAKVKPVYIPPKRSAPIVGMNFESIHKHFLNNFEPLDKIIYDLGVSSDSIIALDVAWNKHDKAWAIPMRDGDNKIIGIHLRCDDGSKKAVLGSKNGLFIPQDIEPQKEVYVCEGMSNCAALLTMGFFAIGRPSCNSGGEMLKVCLKRLGIKWAVIVADNDELKYRSNGESFRPGQDGAKKLKKELGVSSCIFTVPSPLKDVRDLLQKLGAESARNLILQSIASKVWAK